MSTQSSFTCSIIHYPGAEPSRYGGRGSPGIHSADMVNLLLEEALVGSAREVANFDLDDERTEGLTAAMPQLVNVFAAIFFRTGENSGKQRKNGRRQKDGLTRRRCDNRVAGLGIWEKEGYRANPNVDRYWLRILDYAVLLGHVQVVNPWGYLMWNIKWIDLKGRDLMEFSVVGALSSLERSRWL